MIKIRGQRRRAEKRERNFLPLRQARNTRANSLSTTVLFKQYKTTTPPSVYKYTTLRKEIDYTYSLQVSDSNQSKNTEQLETEKVEPEKCSNNRVDDADETTRLLLLGSYCLFIEKIHRPFRSVFSTS